MPIEKNKVYEGVIKGFSSEGFGIARIEGMAVFVPFALEGEVHSIKVLKVLKNMAYGKSECVLKTSEARREPSCPIFKKCGGCDFLHMSYDEELRLKGQRVRDALKRIGGIDIDVGPAEPSQRQGYRNKAVFPVGIYDGKAVPGFYRPRSHDIVPMPENGCLMQDIRLNRLAKAVCRWMNEHGVQPYDEETGKGLVRRIFARCGAKESHLCLVLSSPSLPFKEELTAAALESCPDLAGISVNVNGEKTNRILGEKTFCVYGREYLKDDLLGLDFHISPESFYQVNHAQAQRLYSCALDMAELKENERALDLYCGTGTITLLLAKRCAHALGNEIIPQAVENARENARRNGIENVSFILGDAGKAAFRLSNAGISPDLIVTDPPRKGMDEKAVLACCRMGPRRIVYISCDPASLARDARLFEEKGYKMTKAKAFDMFPATANVETVALLER